MKRRRNSLLGAALVGALVLSACGAGSDADSSPTADDPVAAESSEPAADPVEPDSTPAPDTANTTVDDTATADVVTEEPEAPAEEAPVTQAPVEAAPAEPVLGGRTLTAEVEPASQFDGNPLPDLVVDDVGKGIQVNVANIFPSDRPVLLWAWAPH